VAQDVVEALTMALEARFAVRRRRFDDITAGTARARSAARGDLKRPR